MLKLNTQCRIIKYWQWELACVLLTSTIIVLTAVKSWLAITCIQCWFIRIRIKACPWPVLFRLAISLVLQRASGHPLLLSVPIVTDEHRTWVKRCRICSAVGLYSCSWSSCQWVCWSKFLTWLCWNFFRLSSLHAVCTYPPVISFSSWQWRSACWGGAR